MKLALVLSTAVALVACGGDKVSFETQEQARMQAIENAEYNARSFRDKNAPDFKIMMRGDSTIGPKCAQGDGWATVDLVSKKKIVHLKCSTVSGSIGCLLKADFQERDYAGQDGRCNKDIPFPLPKIQK